MKKVRIYLASTIYDDEPDKSWKKNLRSLLSDDVFSFYDPNPQPDPLLIVVPRDKAEISNSDILVAYIQKPSIGTSMEIMFASLLNTKPIIVINPNTSLFGNIWIEAHAHFICGSIEEAANHIKNMRF